MPDELRESLAVADAPEFEMLRKGGVFMQSDEVREHLYKQGLFRCLPSIKMNASRRLLLLACWLNFVCVGRYSSDAIWKASSSLNVCSLATCRHRKAFYWVKYSLLSSS